MTTTFDTRLASFSSPVLSIFRIIFGLLFTLHGSMKLFALAAGHQGAGRHMAVLVGGPHRIHPRPADRRRTVHADSGFRRFRRDGFRVLLPALAAAGRGPVRPLLAVQCRAGWQRWRTPDHVLLRVPAASHHRCRVAVDRQQAPDRDSSDGKGAASRFRPAAPLRNGRHHHRRNGRHQHRSERVRRPTVGGAEACRGLGCRGRRTCAMR